MGLTLGVLDAGREGIACMELEEEVAVAAEWVAVFCMRVGAAVAADDDGVNVVVVVVVVAAAADEVAVEVEVEED